MSRYILRLYIFLPLQHIAFFCKIACVTNACGTSYPTFNRHVILPKDLAKGLPKSRVLTEQEWRGLGVQQSRGWMHYAIHR